MIIYNVTTKVHHGIAEDWLTWLKNEHVKDVMDTAYFTEYKIVKLLDTDESEGPTYAVQFYAESKSLYNQYIEKYAASMRQKSFDKWGNQFIAFRSLMQIVE